VRDFERALLLIAAEDGFVSHAATVVESQRLSKDVVATSSLKWALISMMLSDNLSTKRVETLEIYDDLQGIPRTVALMNVD